MSQKPEQSKEVTCQYAQGGDALSAPDAGCLVCRGAGKVEGMRRRGDIPYRQVVAPACFTRLIIWPSSRVYGLCTYQGLKGDS